MGELSDVDKEIVRRAAARDSRGAAELLASAYTRWLKSVGRRSVPASDVDDVCGKVWTVVAAGVPPTLEYPRGWLARIAYNKIGNALRERSYQALDSALAEKPMWRSSVTSVRGKLERAEQLDRIRRANPAPAPRDRELLHLAFIDGLKPAAIIAA